ncbi:CBO0543 family protein [Neobacillus driksii]|uniref:CBO0543 family protein n=1 Tax=Neobacillus driksii TaxID=3035913 RepID=UPI0027D7DA06|nr:CBO0543 family protein [Neobacillus niacini]
MKRSFKDWIIVYLVSFIGNFFSDQYLVSRGYLKYPKKLFPKYKIHFPLCSLPFNAALL